MDVLSNRAEALKVVDKGQTGELSLFAVVDDGAEPRVEYVHWVDPKTMFGRRDYLDNEHRVKCILPPGRMCTP